VILSMIGKVSPEDLRKYVFNRVGAVNEAVQVGPAYGEDTAAIDLGDQVLVINSDPIIYAADQIGRLGVNIASNDIAASGAEPSWLTVTYLLPDRENHDLDTISRQIDKVSQELGVAIVGGHSEYVPEITRPFLALTCFGLTENYVPTGGVESGDKLVLTKGAGIEGTGILATDFTDELEEKLPGDVLEQGAKRMDQLSVLPEGLLLRDYASAMHDPTEGGLIDGLLEMATASRLALSVDSEEVIVNSDTEKICEAVNLDPFKIFGSGALIASVPPSEVEEALELLHREGIPATVIGEASDKAEAQLEIDGQIYREPVRDQLYDLWG